MLDMNSLPISGSVIVAGIVWAGVSGFVLGPVVAKRTIENTGWHGMCERSLRSAIAERMPQAQSKPDISCSDVMGVMFGPGGSKLCAQGGDVLFDILKIDPLAAQKEQARRREKRRLSRITEQAPSRCSCAASIVSADRVAWGLYAGSARLIGGPEDVKSDLTQALHAPRCARLGEG